MNLIDKLAGGRARGMPDTAFDPKQLARGTVVELEHTNDFNVAKEIAKDHLVEDPAYYHKLARVDPDVPPALEENPALQENPCECARSSLPNPSRSDVVIVSRHTGAIEWLRQTRPDLADAPVIESARPEDVAGKVVIGNVPLYLAAFAKQVIAIEFTGSPPRGAEYSAEDMRAAGAKLAGYACAPVQDAPPPALADNPQPTPAPLETPPLVEPLADNLANLSARTEVTSAEVGRVEVCSASYCRTGDFLVRGKRAEFVSVEQVERVGKHKRDPSAMPSDVRLPPSLVVAHDPTGGLLSPCDVFVLRWRAAPNGAKKVDADTLRAFKDYYGNNAVPRVGSLSMPRGRWRRIALVKFIRYSRAGFAVAFEHEYAEPVWLYRSGDSDAWRLPLPEGCVIDSRGFVRP